MYVITEHCMLGKHSSVFLQTASVPPDCTSFFLKQKYEFLASM